jgi:hypothetical protein
MTKLVKNCVVIFLLVLCAPWLVSTMLHAVSEGLATTLYSAGGALKTAVLLFGLSLFVYLIPIIGRPLAVLIATFAILIGGIASIVLLVSGGGGNAAPTAPQTVAPAPAAGSAGSGVGTGKDEVFRGSAFPGVVK